ncbi:MAG: hypothetical protein AAB631_02815 [Patescibacteria group bacterium]
MEENTKKDWKKLGLKELISSLFGKFHFTKQAWFPVLGGLFAILIVLFMAVMIRFLGSGLQNAFTPVIPQASVLKFDTAGYEKLNLGKSL